MNRDEKFILTITAGSHLSVHSFMLVFPSILLVLKNEFSVGLDVLGFIATLSALMFGIGAIPSGYFESKVGGRVLLLIYQTGTIVATMVIVMSQSLWMLATGLALLGLFCSIYHPAGLTLISRRISNISKGMALHGIAGSLGLALAPVIAASFTILFSWRAAFGFLAFVNFVLAFFTFFLVPIMKKTIVEEDHRNTKVTNKTALILYYSIGIFMGITFAGFTTFLVSILFLIFTIIWVLTLGLGSPIFLVGGFIFGKWIGTILVTFGLSIGATLLYMFANYFLKDIVEKKFSKKFSSLNEKFKKNEFFFILIYRFIGGIPFFISNILPTLFNVKVKNFFFGSLIGMIPQLFIGVALGSGIEKIINENKELPSFYELITSSEIYIPIFGFIFLLILGIIFKKFFYKN